MINPASRSGAISIYRRLRRINAWPLQKIIITQSHWDHTQGVVFFREQARKEDLPPIEVQASEKAIPFLKDQSYNLSFESNEIYPNHFNIEGILPLKQNQILHIDDNLTLEILETPEHMVDHISLHDKTNRALFIGDAVGMHWFPGLYICNSNSIYWNEDQYLKSLQLIRSINIDYLCIAHFGVFTGEDISKFIDNSEAMYYKWMETFDNNINLLEKPREMLNKVWDSHYKELSEKELLKSTLLNALINAIRYYKSKFKT